MDRLDTLRLLVRAAELASFSKAAAESELRQSTVSKAIASLEAQWGVALFLRSARGVTLTETGRAAIDRARAALDAVDGLDHELSGRDRAPIGLLRVHASVAVARYALAPIAVDFLKAYPQVRVEFLANDRTMSLIDAGIDLAFMLGVIEDSPFFTKKICRFDRVLAASSSFISRNKEINTPEDLSSCSCVIFTTTPDPDIWRFSNGSRRASVNVSGSVSANSGGIVHEAMLRGVGVGFVPEFIVMDDLRTGKLQRVLPKWRGDGLDLSAVWPSNQRLPAKARVFMDFVAKRMGQTSQNLSATPHR